MSTRQNFLYSLLVLILDVSVVGQVASLGAILGEPNGRSYEALTAPAAFANGFYVAVREQEKLSLILWNKSRSVFTIITGIDPKILFKPRNISTKTTNTANLPVVQSHPPYLYMPILDCSSDGRYVILRAGHPLASLETGIEKCYLINTSDKKWVEVFPSESGRGERAPIFLSGSHRLLNCLPSEQKDGFYSLVEYDCNTGRYTDSEIRMRFRAYSLQEILDKSAHYVVINALPDWLAIADLTKKNQYPFGDDEHGLYILGPAAVGSLISKQRAFFSPNARSIIVSNYLLATSGDNARARIMTLTTAIPRAHLPEAHFCGWSSDGKFVALTTPGWESRDALMVFDSQGTKITSYTPNPRRAVDFVRCFNLSEFLFYDPSIKRFCIFTLPEGLVRQIAEEFLYQ